MVDLVFMFSLAGITSDYHYTYHLNLNPGALGPGARSGEVILKIDSELNMLELLHCTWSWLN